MLLDNDRKQQSSIWLDERLSWSSERMILVFVRVNL